MRKGIEKIIEFYNRRNNPNYEPYISFLKETDLPLKVIHDIDILAYDIGNNKDVNVMNNFVSDIKKYGKDVSLFGYPNYVILDDKVKSKIIEFYYSHEYPKNELYSKLYIVKNKYNMSDKWMNDMLAFYDKCPSDLSKKAYSHFVSKCVNSDKDLLISDFIKYGENSFVCNMFLQDVCVIECRVRDSNIYEVDCNLMDILDYNVFTRNNYLPYYLMTDISNIHLEEYKVCEYSTLNIVLKHISENPIMNWFHNRYVYTMENDGIHYYYIDNYDEDLYKKFLAVSQDVNFSIKSPYYSNSIKIVPDKGVFITCKKYDEIYHYATSERAHYGNLKTNSEIVLWFTLDNHVLMSVNARNADKARFVPASIKSIYQKQSGNKFLMELLHSFANDLNYKFLKDILYDFDTTAHRVSTITFNDAMTYPNRRLYVADKYKAIKDLKINYNNTNINLAYLLNKSIKYIDKSQYGYLSQIHTLDFIPDHIYFSSRIAAREFLKCYYLFYKKYDDYTSDNHKIEDYIEMMIQQKNKIPLNYSLKRLLEEHDKLSDEENINNYLKNMRGQKVRVPKNSKFNDLRKVLPKDFEWIKTKTRLAKESAIQHHCVWSYGDYITKDTSAIYSYVDTTGKYGEKDTRYTIEFRHDKKGFYIRQMQKKYDRGGSEKLEKELNKLIKAA